MKEAWQTVRGKLRSVGIEVSDVDEATLEVYAREGIRSDVISNLVYGYGLTLFDRFDSGKLNVWKHQLALPLPGDCAAAQEALHGEAVSFEAAVGALTGPVTRLVAIHLYNALIANHVSIANAKNLDMAVWGSTEAFFNRKVPFSLVPLTRAYGPRQLSDSFPTALEALAVDQLAKITHSQVRTAFQKLIVELAQ